MSNPVLNKASSVSQNMPRIGQRAMTLDDVVRTTVSMFAVLLVFAGIGWFFGNFAIFIVALIAALVVGLVASFKRNPSPPLYFLYAGLQGYVLGFFSRFMEQIAPGAVSQAVLATFAVFAVMLFLFKTNIVTGGSRIVKFLIISMSAYFLFMIINLVLTLTGVFDSFGGMLTGVTIMGIPLGIFTGLFAIVLGALSLSVDFRGIKDGVGVEPEKMAWYYSFGLMLSLVWIYTEILRLIGIVNVTGD